MSDIPSNNSAVLTALFGSGVRSPMPSTSTHRPHLAHSKSIGAEPSAMASPPIPTTPKARPGKRVPRRSTTSLCVSSATSSPLPPVPLMSITTPSTGGRKAGSMSPQSLSSRGYRTPSGGSALSGHAHSPSPFAGAKFSESPSARAVPLPPTTWMEDEELESSLDSSISSDTESTMSFGGGSSSSVGGVRMNPLQLIAAAASS